MFQVRVRRRVRETAGRDRPALHHVRGCVQQCDVGGLRRAWSQQDAVPAWLHHIVHGQRICRLDQERAGRGAITQAFLRLRRTPRPTPSFNTCAMVRGPPDRPHARPKGGLLQLLGHRQAFLRTALHVPGGARARHHTTR